MRLNLTSIFLLVACLHMYAAGYSQLISLNERNAPLEKVMIKLEEQSGYSFFLQSNLLTISKRVTLRVKNTPLEKVLDEVFRNQPLSYSIVSKTIVIKKKEEAALFEKSIINRASSITLADIESKPGLPELQVGLIQNVKRALTEINGKVTDAKGDGLPGVSVVVKGTTTGTTTNVDGVFSLNVPDNSGRLVFSHLGYISQEKTYIGATTINVVLAEDSRNIDEVVVTALGIKRESKTLGYATATATPEQIAVNKTANFMNALQGKLAGVNITQMGTGPAGTTKIRIRGQSSLGAENSPLIVVNGIPINNSTYGIGGNNPTRGTGTSDGGDGLSSINPDDIETMNVLKGAAAAALYGARAKDGVIMITTRTKGANRGIGVEVTSNVTSDSPLDYTDFQYEYGEGENGVRPTAPNPTSGVWSFGERFQPGMTQILFDGVEVPYVPQYNRYKKFYRTGYTFTNTVAVSSGGPNGGFNLSISNLDNTSIIPNSDYHRKTINLGFTQNITPKLIISGNVNYSKENNRNPPVISGNGFNIALVINTLSNSMPLDLLDQKRYDAAGNETVFSRFRNRTNPYISAYDRFENITRDRLFGNISARYNFTDWLYLQARVGQDYFARNRDYNNPTGIAFLSPAPAGFFNGIYNQEAGHFREINADFLLSATRKFKDFGVNVTLGGNQRYVQSDLSSVYVQDFIVKGLYTVANGRQKEPGFTNSERQINSLYGAAEVSYKEFLFLNATARNDWFSTLSPENRSILYPSVTGSFVFSQAFDNLPTWLTFSKLRASYARVGSDLDIAPYANRLFYGVNANLFTSYDGSLQPLGTISTGTIPNASLHPMNVSEVEFGTELKLFQNRVGVDLTYYQKLSSDQILAAQTSDASAYTSQLINVGKSKTQGVELLLTLAPVQTTNFQWNVSFNASYNTSEVLKLGNSDKDVTIGGNLRFVVGQPLGQIYGFGYLRDSQGRQVFDKNTGLPLRTPDLIRLGSALPKYFGGITNQFNYKGINLSFLIDFKLGHDMFSQTNWNAYRHGLHKATLVGREQNYVIGDGVNPGGEVNTTKANLQQFYSIDNTQIREGFVENAGFWKLRQVTLGYDFTKLLPKTFFIKGIRVNAVANNVLILKKWIQNIDPEEFSNISDTSTGLGGDGGTPTTRSIGVNVNLKF
ncbi:SusC/RagA family TonB-linked outer membrane protein [Spirosoma flavus]